MLAHATKALILLPMFVLPGFGNPPRPDPDALDAPRAVHLLDRAAYGPTAGDLAEARRLGLSRWLDAQIADATGSEPAALQARLDALATLHMSPSELYRTFDAPRRAAEKRGDQAATREAAKREREPVDQATEARLLRAIASPHQLREVMVDFWFNHFNVYGDKELDRLWVGAYEEQAIRPYALGRFRDLLGAVAHHPAMLMYLDNWLNRADRVGKDGKVTPGLNENFGRELMELHTLGVDGGYGQPDVVALARILTGWGFRRPYSDDPEAFDFRFDPRRHDAGDKPFLGKTMPGGGEGEGELALDLLARSPATAHHLAYELAQAFVSDQPPPRLVNRLAKRYAETDGDIAAMLRTLFRSGEFWSASARGAKFKAPLRYVVSAVRASDAGVRDVRPLEAALRKLGEPLYGCLTPDGYATTQQAWLSPDGLQQRLSFGVAFSGGRLRLRGEGDRDPTVEAATLTAALGDQLSPRTRAAIGAAPADLRAAVILGSPEFLHH